MASNCDIHLEGSLLDETDQAAIRKEITGRKIKDVQGVRDIVDATIRASVEDGIERRVRDVSDMVKVEDMVEKLTTNPFSGEAFKSYSDVIKHRLDSLIGRNSVDTRARTLRNHFRNKRDEFEMMFRTNENKAIKSIREIQKGSNEERELYKLVWAYEKEIDPDTLTPQKVNQLLQDVNGMDVGANSDLHRLALSMVSYNAYTRKTMGAYGVSVKYAKNYVTKRNYDWAALEKMGAEKFSEFMADRLDLEASFGKGVSREAALFKLRDIYGEMNVGATERTSVLSSKEFTGSRANSIARKFVYKDSDSAYDAFDQLSVGSLSSQMDRNAVNMANTAIKVSEFGYDAKGVLEQVNARIQEAYATPSGTIDKWRETRIRAAEMDLLGQQNLVQGSITNFANNTRFIMAFSKLGNAVTGTILDVVDNGRQAFYVNGDVFGGFADYGRNLLKVTTGMSKEQKVELAQELNLIYAHMSNAEALRLTDGGTAINGGALTKMIQEHGTTALNATSLLPYQTGVSKLASGLTGSRTFAKMVDKVKSGKELNKFEIDTMREYGFTKSEIATLGSGLVERTDAWSDTAIFTGSGIRKSLLEGDMKKVAASLEVEEGRAGQAVMDLATKVESFVNDFVTRGTPTPELATKVLMGKTEGSELKRATIGLATQFLDTPLAQGQYMMELVDKLMRINNNNIPAVLKDALPHAGVYLSVAIPIYMAADYTMAAITQRESLVDKYRNGDTDTRNKVMLNAIGRTGLVPFLFEVIESQTGGGYNKTALDTFGSPALSTARDMLRLAQPDSNMDFGEFVRRQGPSNSIPVRMLNNWSARATGEKLFQDNQGLFNSSELF